MAAAFGLAAAFLGATAVVFFGAAAFLGAAALVTVGFFGAAGFLGAVGFAVLGSGLASFTGPEAPLGCANSPASTPALRARLNRESKVAVEATLRVLLARTYFLIA